MFLQHRLESVLHSELVTYHLRKAVTGCSGWDTGRVLLLTGVQEILPECKNYLIYQGRIAKWLSACSLVSEFDMWPCHVQ